MKKFFAMVLVGALTVAMVLPVSATTSPTAKDINVNVTIKADRHHHHHHRRNDGPSSKPGNVGYSQRVISLAEAAGKTAVEYVNNAVIYTPGLGEVVPIAQGGHVVINGTSTRYVFAMNKVDANTAQAASNAAKGLGGTLLNVCRTSSDILPTFQNATVPFYIQGAKAGMNIKAYRMVGGTWQELPSSVRQDHIDVQMTGHETMMFVVLP